MNFAVGDTVIFARLPPEVPLTDPLGTPARELERRSLVASALCSVCGGDTLDGSSSCVNMTFCKKCQPRIDEFRTKYLEDAKSRASGMGRLS
jgi:hypothetical protein